MIAFNNCKINMFSSISCSEIKIISFNIDGMISLNRTLYSWFLDVFYN